MIRAIRSYFTSLRASATLGRADRLQRAGKIEEGVSVAREGLELLRAPHVVRTHPAEGAVLSGLTVLIEGAAHSHGLVGADVRDIRDSVEFLKQLPEGSTELRAWVPYLEGRLGGQSAA